MCLESILQSTQYVSYIYRHMTSGRTDWSKIRSIYMCSHSELDILLNWCAPEFNNALKSSVQCTKCSYFSCVVILWVKRVNQLAVFIWISKYTGVCLCVLHWMWVHCWIERAPVEWKFQLCRHRKPKCGHNLILSFVWIIFVVLQNPTEMFFY